MQTIAYTWSIFFRYLPLGLVAGAALALGLRCAFFYLWLRIGGRRCLELLRSLVLPFLVVGVFMSLIVGYLISSPYFFGAVEIPYGYLVMALGVAVGAIIGALIALFFAALYLAGFKAK